MATTHRLISIQMALEPTVLGEMLLLCDEILRLLCCAATGRRVAVAITSRLRDVLTSQLIGEITFGNGKLWTSWDSLCLRQLLFITKARLILKPVL